MIKFNEVSKAYGSIQALRNVSLEIQSGECLVLVGPSGCGKSTLIKAVNRMVEVDKGEILIEDTSLYSYPPEILRRKMGYCIQGVGLFPHYSVQDNIAIVPRLLGWEEEKIRSRIAMLMEISELPASYLAKKPHELSGGESQRVGVCRALAGDPPILLMDEPFGAVDPLTRGRLQQAFNRIQLELRKTVIFVTHDVEEAVILADRVALMQQGEILACENPRELYRMTDPPVIRSFLGKDFGIHLLNRYRIYEIFPYLPKMDTLSGPEITRYAVNQQTTVKEILAELLAENLNQLILEDATGNYLLHYDNILYFLHEVAM